ncbi:MAG: TIGR02147 family protein [bacterium]|nr:TIGR02147 family protein [bacterium]
MRQIQILDYSNYRVFLKDCYEKKKQQLGKYSYRQFSDDMGFAASNYLHLVVSGQRNLSEDAVNKILTRFKWQANEKKFFKNLVLYNQAKKDEDKNKYRQILEKILGKKRVLIGFDQFSYFSKWYLPILREMVALKNFVPNLNWISNRIQPNIPEEDIKNGLTVLERLKMIQRHKNKWKQSEEHLTTPIQINSSMVHNYHREMLNLSLNALEMNPDKRDISAMTMSLSKQQYEWLKQRVIDFRDEVQQELQGMQGDHTLVAQLNIQLFPTTK